MQINLKTLKEKCEVHFSVVVEENEWKDAQHKATIDLAKKTDGTWVLIEVGDGQVSHLRGYDVDKFYTCFLSLLSKDYDIYNL